AEMVEVGLAVALGDLELVPEVESGGRTVEARTDVRRARGCADTHGCHRDASAIASGSGSTATGSGLKRAAVSGSLRPCPVTTHTTIESRCSSTVPRAARPAADD